jgi:hypothetical protein
MYYGLCLSQGDGHRHLLVQVEVSKQAGSRRLLLEVGIIQQLEAFSVNDE